MPRSRDIASVLSRIQSGARSNQGRGLGVPAPLGRSCRLAVGASDRALPLLLLVPTAAATAAAWSLQGHPLLTDGEGLTTRRHLLDCSYKQLKGKVPILSIEAIHQLHIFIFVLAATHVVLSAVTVILGITQTRKWRHWEGKIQQSDNNGPQMTRHVQEFKFIKNHFRGHGKRWEIFGWLCSFFKQFYGSVTEEDYTTLRLGFVMVETQQGTSEIQLLQLYE